jgi:site-specific DNA-cytosine methylase
MLWFTKSRRAQSVDDYETWIAGGVMPTLNAFDNGDVRTTILIIDGTRVGDVRVYEDQVMQTVISRWGTGGGNVPAIYPIHDKATRFNGKRKLANGEYSMDGAGNGLGIGEDGAPMNTLTGADRHAVAYDEYNDSINDTHHTLRAGTKQSTGVLHSSVVRRLTPVECERLQGFPDDWTEGQADTHRYKQMGNAVTVNVARWIGERL